MRLEKFTLRGQEAIQSAIEVAERNQNQEVQPEHVLFSMLEQPEGIVRPVLGKLGRLPSRAFPKCRAGNSISVRV